MNREDYIKRLLQVTDYEVFYSPSIEVIEQCLLSLKPGDWCITRQWDASSSSKKIYGIKRYIRSSWLLEIEGFALHQLYDLEDSICRDMAEARHACEVVSQVVHRLRGTSE